jgi:hypothetical protein
MVQIFAGESKWKKLINNFLTFYDKKMVRNDEKLLEIIISSIFGL